MIEMVPTRAIALNATLVQLWDEGIGEGVSKASDILDLCAFNPSDSKEVIYTFCPEIRALRRRAKGSNETIIDPVNLYDASLENEDFYRFFDVGLNDYNDDKIGRYSSVAHHFGVLAGTGPANEVETVISGGNAATALCYDGLPFFSTAHLVDPSVASSATWSNYITKAAGLTLDTFGEGYQAMEEIPSADGKAAGTEPTHIVVPPKYRGVATDIATLEYPTGLNGAANKWKGLGLKVMVVKNWKDLDIWMLADCGSSRQRPFVFQEREKVQMRPLYINPDGGWERSNRRMRWSTEGRFAAGYGYPTKAMLFHK